MLILAACVRLGLVGGDILDHGNNHVALTGEPQHAIPFLPVGNVEARVVNPWVVKTLWRRGNPGPQEYCEIPARHYRFAPSDVQGTCKQHTHSVDLELVQAFDTVVMILSSRQPMSQNAVVPL